MCSPPPSKFSQGQDRDRSLFFSILQGTDKVIRHLKKLLIIGEGGLGYLSTGGMRFLPVLSEMTPHGGVRLSRLVFRNILPMLGARSPGFRSPCCCCCCSACGVCCTATSL